MSLGTDIDYLFTLRAARKALEDIVNEKLKEEKALELVIIAQLNEEHLEGARGNKAQFSISEQELPRVTNWPDLYDFIRLNNAFELLHKRIGVTEWATYKEDGVLIPGTEILKITKSSLRKLS